jgi:hypothetical protein
MKTIPFTTDEACIVDGPIPQDVATKLWLHHFIPMAPVRHELGAPITASQKSGYRPEEHELKMGRSGNSQHTFKGKGAIDWTANDLKRLLQLILKHTRYTRIAVYNSFIHCDYKETKSGKREVYSSTSKSIWTLKWVLD